MSSSDSSFNQSEFINAILLCDNEFDTISMKILNDGFYMYVIAL